MSRLEITLKMYNNKQAKKAKKTDKTKPKDSHIVVDIIEHDKQHLDRFHLNYAYRFCGCGTYNMYMINWVKV